MSGASSLSTSVAGIDMRAGSRRRAKTNLSMRLTLVLARDQRLLRRVYRIRIFSPPGSFGSCREVLKCVTSH